MDYKLAEFVVSYDDELERAKNLLDQLNMYLMIVPEQKMWIMLDGKKGIKIIPQEKPIQHIIHKISGMEFDAYHNVGEDSVPYVYP
ncbi:MAG: hypothetical protein QXR09_03780 [Candidatus Aenigmatarchaeota archaeon]